VRHFDLRLALRVGVVVALAMVAALAVGGAVSVVVVSVTRSGATGGLSELGNAMAAGAGGILAAALVYTAATIISVPAPVAASIGLAGREPTSTRRAP
jgi:hypothetical protein